MTKHQVGFVVRGLLFFTLPMFIITVGLVIWESQQQTKSRVKVLEFAPNNVMGHDQTTDPPEHLRKMNRVSD